MILVSVENDHDYVREIGTSLCMCYLGVSEGERCLFLMDAVCDTVALN